MIESWLYSWVVIHFHINGYSQLLAKYCYHVKKISYRNFYDTVFDLVFQHDSCIGEEARKMQKIITNFYTLGHTGKHDVTAGDMLFHSSANFYLNIDHVINIALQVAANFGDIDSGICEIQKRYIANDTWTVPYTITTNVDIENWQPESCKYQITGPNNNFKVDQLVLFTLQRRNKTLYNIIEKLEKKEDQIFRVCNCGRSATGFCTGLHALTEEEWDARVFDEAFLNEEKHKNEHKS
jgi:CDGSH-type Zn-finger protein